jgi:uncharacterized delta-60 repeat protein
VAGSGVNGLQQDFAIIRYTTSGVPDPTFGAGGVLTVPVTAGASAAEAVAIQADGKIVVAGEGLDGTGPSATVAFVVARFTPNGVFDPSFGSAGTVLTHAGLGGAQVSGMALQPDGKIVVGGHVTVARNGGVIDGAVLRYNADGSLDSSFAGTGVVAPAIGDNSDFTGLALQADGRIVLAGSTMIGTRHDILVVRFGTNGVPDASFGTDGIVTTQITPGSAVGQDVALQPDGLIVVAGYAYNGPIGVIAMVRYAVDGRVDTTFGTAGIARASDTHDVVPYGMAVGPDGSLVAAGTLITDGDHATMLVARFGVTYSRLTPVSPTRVLDTRVGGVRPAAGSITRVSTGVAAGTSAVLVNLTVTGAVAPGYITADRCSVLVAGPQSKSNANYQAGLDIANTAVVNVDADGSFCIYTGQGAHLLVDLQGRFADVGLRLVTASPTRVRDTRDGTRPAAGSITRVSTGVAAGTSAVLVNLTVTGAVAPGYITADRCSVLVAGPQSKSNANYQAGQDIANTAVVNVDADGSFCIYTDQSAHLLVDLQGTYQAASGHELAAFAPRRALDTRQSTRPSAGSITRVATRVAPGATSVLVNVTVTGAVAPGYITADRCSVLVAGPQSKSNVNYQAGQDVANTAVVNVDADGSFCIYTDQAAHLLADLQGVHLS